MRHACAALALLLFAACGPSEIAGTRAFVDTASDLAGDHFFDYPWPSDERLDANGAPAAAAFPNPPAPEPNAMVAKFAAMNAERQGFPVIAAAYFRFDAPLATRDPKDVIPASPEGPLVLMDVDPASPERGKLFPVVAATVPEDAYTPPNLLAIAPRPGIVLAPHRTYAYLVLRSLNDAAKHPLGVPLAVAKAVDGDETALRRTQRQGPAAKKLDLPTSLAKAGIAPSSVAALTTFTTGDVVEELQALGNKLKDAYHPTIDGLHVPDSGDHPRFCELEGTITFPQFQKGTPPFDADGLFVTGADGLPVKQREETAPVVLSLPKGAMPAGGYPLMMYFHGSGGIPQESVDRGKTLTSDGEPTKGEGPSFVVAPFGLATAATAFPVNPQRLPGASDFAYLNPNNVPAVRDTFRQGVLEQRMFIEALRTLSIPAETLQGCTGVTLPEGAAGFHFDPAKLVAMGHSMGAMYLNMISATEPRILADVSSGSGGYWTYFLLQTHLVPGATLLGSLLGADATTLTYLHPAVQLAENAIETVDPLVFTARVGRRPLAGAPVRPVYEPAGFNDRYFPPTVLDAIATGYAHREAGKQVWTSMQDALSLEGRGGLIDYPVKNDVTSVDGTPYTGVVVQYEGDGLADPHNVAFQLDEVKYQYGCFLSTFLATGSATVPAPAPLGTPCPGMP